MSQVSGTDLFHVECCNRRRGVAPGNVLVCSVCDFDHNHATVMPNEYRIKDVPEHLTVVRMTRNI
jgi:hypothetical protein